MGRHTATPNKQPLHSSHKHTLRITKTMDNYTPRSCKTRNHNQKNMRRCLLTPQTHFIWTRTKENWWTKQNLNSIQPATASPSAHSTWSPWARIKSEFASSLTVTIYHPLHLPRLAASLLPVTHESLNSSGWKGLKLLRQEGIIRLKTGFIYGDANWVW